MINYQNMKMLLESILVEDKLSDLQSRYKDIHPDTIKDIWDNGVPSNNQGKYIDWSIKENNKSHNPTRTKNALEIYDRNKDKIGKFNHQWSIDDLESVTHPFTDEGKSFNKKAEEGTSIHYEDDDIIVRQHSNHESAVKAGFLHPSNECYNTTKEPGKAQWCVSANSEAGKNHFNNTYTENGRYPLYTIENKKDKTKSAIILNPSRSPELRDEHDTAKKSYEMIYRHPSIVNSELGNRLLNIRNTRDMLNHVPVNASEDQLLKALNHDNHEIRKLAISHKNVTEQMLLKGLDHDNPEVRKLVVSHPKATEQVLLKGLDDNVTDHIAANNPNISESLLLTHKVLHLHHYHKKSAATENVLLKAVAAPVSDFNMAKIAAHDNATKKVLSSILALPHPKPSPLMVDYIGKAKEIARARLNGDKESLRRLLMSNKNA